MKSSEQCFLEILELIKLNQTQEFIKTRDAWCKLRNFDNSYIFSGKIILDDDTNTILYFYFSNKTSCLSIESQEHLLNDLKLVDNLFDKYHIDEFINSYVKKI
jgi:hypothetical protein